MSFTIEFETRDGQRVAVYKNASDEEIGVAAADDSTPDPPAEDTDLTAILAVDPATATTEDVMTALQWIVQKLR